MVTLHFLGTGGPKPHVSRFGSALAVDLGTEILLFDCGPSTTTRMFAADLDLTRVTTVFLTHHHFDHTADFPCFVLTRWDQSNGQQPQLRVIGPAHTEEFVDRLLDRERGAFAADWIARTSTLGSRTRYNMRGGKGDRPGPSIGPDGWVHPTNVKAGVVHQGEGWTVTAAETVHAQPWLESFAYRLDHEDFSLVITGDTEPCESVVELAKGADYFACMCWEDEETRRDPSWEGQGVCGVRGAADMASEAGVATLILTHIDPDLSAHGPLEKAIGTVSGKFSGQVLVAEELMTLDVGADLTAKTW